MIFEIKNEYSIVLRELKAESEEEALEKYATEAGYDCFNDIPIRNRKKLKVVEKSSGNSQ